MLYSSMANSPGASERAVLLFSLCAFSLSQLAGMNAGSIFPSLLYSPGPLNIVQIK